MVVGDQTPYARVQTEQQAEPQVTTRATTHQMRQSSIHDHLLMLSSLHHVVHEDGGEYQTTPYCGPTMQLLPSKNSKYLRRRRQALLHTHTHTQEGKDVHIHITRQDDCNTRGFTHIRARACVGNNEAMTNNPVWTIESTTMQRPQGTSHRTPRQANQNKDVSEARHLSASSIGGNVYQRWSNGAGVMS